MLGAGVKTGLAQRYVAPKLAHHNHRAVIGAMPSSQRRETIQVTSTDTSAIPLYWLRWRNEQLSSAFDNPKIWDCARQTPQNDWWIFYRQDTRPNLSQRTHICLTLMIYARQFHNWECLLHTWGHVLTPSSGQEKENGCIRTIFDRKQEVWSHDCEILECASQTTIEPRVLTWQRWSRFKTVRNWNGSSNGLNGIHVGSLEYVTHVSGLRKNYTILCAYRLNAKEEVRGAQISNFEGARQFLHNWVHEVTITVQN